MNKLLLPALCALIFLVKTPEAYAAFLSLEPAGGQFSAGGSLQVKVNIDTEGLATTSTDAVLLFDPNLLEYADVIPGSFYPENFKYLPGSGKLYAGGAVSSGGQTKTGSGTISTVVFNAKYGGTAKITFDCTAGKTNDSNITRDDSQATDILDCAKNINGSYDVLGSGAPSLTPTPTFILPESGSLTAPFAGLAVGIFSLLMGLILVF